MPFPRQQRRVEKDRCYRKQLKAALNGDWAATNQMFEGDTALKIAISMSESQTVLHVAAVSTQEQFVENLVELLSTEELEVADGKDCTAIHYATWCDLHYHLRLSRNGYA